MLKNNKKPRRFLRSEDQQERQKVTPYSRKVKHKQYDY